MPPIRRLWLALALGAVARLLALPMPGAGDVALFKVTSFHSLRSGITRIYGVATPPDHAEFQFAGVTTHADYPPVAHYELAVPAWVYDRATGGRFIDSDALTATIKALPVLFEVGFACLLFGTLRHVKGEDAARWAVTAFWLNPASILNASVGGYLDMLVVLPAAAALIAAASARPGVAGALIAIAVLTKPQAVWLVPIVGLAACNSADARREGGVRLARLIGAALATTALILMPFIVAGTLLNMFAMVWTLTSHPWISMFAHNAWWLFSHIVTTATAASRGSTMLETFLAPVWPPNGDEALSSGLPILKFIATAGTSGLVGWAVWTGRHVRDLPRLAALGAFSIHAYATVGPLVHENHLFLVVPFLVIAAAGRAPFIPILGAVTIGSCLNMLTWGFDVGPHTKVQIPIRFTIVDTTILFALFNCGVFVWHAMTVRLECVRETAL